MVEIRWKKYILTFCITATIFILAFFANSLFNNKRLDEIREIENRVSLNLLALEVESDLLAGLSCEDEHVSLTAEDMGSLGERLSYLEEQGGDREVVKALKTQYSLFQLKDYLLLKQLNQRCGEGLHFIFYFYSNEGDCEDCARQGYVLQKMREENPLLRIYSFDYGLEVPGVSSLKRFYGLTRELPIMIADRQVVYGFHDEQSLFDLLGMEKESSKNAFKEEI